MSQAGIASGSSGGGGGSNIQTITGNTGGAVGPDGSNNINFPGATLYTVTGNPGANSLTINPRPNAYPITPYVVGPVGAAGYQTIQSGINAANAVGGGVVYIQPGAYTENLTLFSGVDLYATPAVSQAQGASVNITGTHTPPTSGHCGFNSIVFISTTNAFLSASVGTTHLAFVNCESAIQNGYFLNLPSWTGTLEIYDNNPNTAGAPFVVNDGGINNTGGSTILVFSAAIGFGTNVMNLSGLVIAQAMSFDCPVNFQTGSNIQCENAIFTGNVTLSNNSTGFFRSCHFTPGTVSPAITMSSSAAIEVSNAVITTTNNPAINGSGAGTFTYEDLVFPNNSTIAGTLTTATVSWQPYSRAIAATDATKVGTCSFNSAQFTVDANGFVSTSGSGPGLTITGQSGGALSPVAGNWNILGGPGVTTSGAGNTLTINSVVFTDQGASGSVVQDSGSYTTAAITLTTPAAPLQGHELIFACTNASTLVIKAAGAQLIRIGSLISSVGGTATSTLIGDSVTLRFRTSDSTWYAVSVIGIWVMA